MVDQRCTVIYLFIIVETTLRARVVNSCKHLILSNFQFQFLLLIISMEGFRLKIIFKFCSGRKENHAFHSLRIIVFTAMSLLYSKI